MDTPAACINIYTNCVSVQAWISEFKFNYHTHDRQEAMNVVFKCIKYLTDRVEVLYIANEDDCIINNNAFNIKKINLNIKEICLAIAVTENRIGAIVVNYHEMTPFLLKKIRELTSAEGALFLVNALKVKSINEIFFKSSIPDALICILDRTYWVASKFNINPYTKNAG